MIIVAYSAGGLAIQHPSSPVVACGQVKSQLNYILPTRSSHGVDHKTRDRDPENYVPSRVRVVWNIWEIIWEIQELGVLRLDFVNLRDFKQFITTYQSGSRIAVVTVILIDQNADFGFVLTLDSLLQKSR